MMQFQQSSDSYSGSSEARITLSELEGGGWAFYIHNDLSLDMGPPEKGVGLGEGGALYLMKGADH